MGVSRNIHLEESRNKVTKITEGSLDRMPRSAAKRLRPGLRPEVEVEFLECMGDMGYEAHLASPMMGQMLFELFVGGWGAKTRQLKRRKARDV
jgi:hypothetical protein